MTFVPFPMGPEPPPRYVRTTPAHEKALRTRSTLVGTSQIIVCLTAVAVLITGEMNGYSVLIGSLVTFTGLLTGATTLFARNYVRDASLNIAGATVLRRLIIAFTNCSAVLAALSLIPLVAGAHPRGTETAATLSGVITATAIICTLSGLATDHPTPPPLTFVTTAPARDRSGRIHTIDSSQVRKRQAGLHEARRLPTTSQRSTVGPLVEKFEHPLMPPSALSRTRSGDAQHTGNSWRMQRARARTSRSLASGRSETGDMRTLETNVKCAEATATEANPESRSTFSQVRA
jgi:hypothetical protein